MANCPLVARSFAAMIVHCGHIGTMAGVRIRRRELVRLALPVITFGLLSACSAMLVADGTSTGSGLGQDDRTGSQASADDALAASVTQALAANSQLSTANLSVKARSGVVTLAGTVAGFEARDQAIEIAGNIDAVVQVNNQIQVKTK